MSTAATDLTNWTAAQVADAVRSGQVSAVEVAQAPSSTGSRPSTARCTPSCTSIARVRCRRAEAVDAKRAAGEQLGPLAGVPLALKDVFTTRGMPTTCASRILEGWRPPYDATVTQRLRDADIVVLGKTNMDEFAMGSSTENSAYGPTPTPGTSPGSPGVRPVVRQPRSRPARRR